MTFQTGTYLGGIRDLQGIMDRCRIDPDTKCWHWSQSTGRNGEPRGWVKFPWNEKPKSVTIRNAVAIFSRGKPLPNGWRSWVKCDSPDCCNPGHVKFGPSAELGEYLAGKGVLKNLPTKIAANRKTVAAKHRKLTDEQVKEIRASSEACAALAPKYGVCPNVISTIRLHKSYKTSTVMNGASVFDWRPKVAEAA